VVIMAKLQQRIYILNEMLWKSKQLHVEKYPKKFHGFRYQRQKISLTKENLISQEFCFYGQGLPTIKS